MSRALIAMLVLVTACGSKTDSTKAAPSTANVKGSAAPSATPPPSLPANAGSGAPHIRCDAEIEIVCPDGYDDGCTGKKTESHVCVRKDATATTPCDADIMLSCPEGETDSCFVHPPYGKLHVCVLTKH